MNIVTFVINSDAHTGTPLATFQRPGICLPEKYFVLYLVVLKKKYIKRTLLYMKESGKSNLTDLSSDVSEILKTGGQKRAPIWSTHLSQMYQLIHDTRYWHRSLSLQIQKRYYLTSNRVKRQNAQIYISH
jgi:hypothetical protein